MIIKREFPSYNSRRYGKPWGARVTFPDGIRPIYVFDGHWDGHAVLINAEIGGILAFGQKDTRGHNSTNQLYRVDADGGLVSVTEARAREVATKGISK